MPPWPCLAVCLSKSCQHQNSPSTTQLADTQANSPTPQVPARLRTWGIDLRTWGIEKSKSAKSPTPRHACALGELGSWGLGVPKQPATSPLPISQTHPDIFANPHFFSTLQLCNSANSQLPNSPARLRTWGVGELGSWKPPQINF